MSSLIQQNLVPDQPSLADAFVLLKKEIMLGLNCHHIGQIVEFDPDDQTASVSINYPKTFFKFNELTKAYESTTTSYPIPMQCPVMCLGGGSAALTFPILPGDECLVLFNDRDFDNWFAGGTGSPANTARLHSFADALVIVGIRSLPHVLTEYDMVRAVLRSGPGGIAGVGVGPSLIKIYNSTTTLNTLLQSLITDIKSLVSATAAITVAVTTAPGTSGPPLNATAITAVSSSLSMLAGQIAGLLE